MLVAGAAFAGCGGDDDSGSDGPKPQTKMAKFYDGESWAGGELRTCLETDGKLAIVVGQEAEPIEMYDADNYMNIENKAGEILLFNSIKKTEEMKDRYLSTVAEGDESGVKGNAVYRISAGMDPQKAANMKGCVGVE